MIIEGTISPDAQIINVAAAIRNSLQDVHHALLSNIRGDLHSHWKPVVGVVSLLSGDDADLLTSFG